MSLNDGARNDELNAAYEEAVEREEKRKRLERSGLIIIAEHSVGVSDGSKDEHVVTSTGAWSIRTEVIGVARSEEAAKRWTVERYRRVSKVQHLGVWWPNCSYVKVPLIEAEDIYVIPEEEYLSAKKCVEICEKLWEKASPEDFGETLYEIGCALGKA